MVHSLRTRQIKPPRHYPPPPMMDAREFSLNWDGNFSQKMTPPLSESDEVFFSASHYSNQLQIPPLGDLKIQLRIGIIAARDEKSKKLGGSRGCIRGNRTMPYLFSKIRWSIRSEGGSQAAVSPIFFLMFPPSRILANAIASRRGAVVIPCALCFPSRCVPYLKWEKAIMASVWITSDYINGGSGGG